MPPTQPSPSISASAAGSCGRSSTFRAPPSERSSAGRLRDWVATQAAEAALLAAIPDSSAPDRLAALIAGPHPRPACRARRRHPPGPRPEPRQPGSRATAGRVGAAPRRQHRRRRVRAHRHRRRVARKVSLRSGSLSEPRFSALSTGARMRTAANSPQPRLASPQPAREPARYRYPEWTWWPPVQARAVGLSGGRDAPAGLVSRRSRGALR